MSQFGNRFTYSTTRGIVHWQLRVLDYIVLIKSHLLPVMALWHRQNWLHGASWDLSRMYD